MAKDASSLIFGKDHVERRGEQLVVCSLVDMPDWQIREKRKTAIIVGDEVFSLAGKEVGKAGNLRYILDPWPKYIHQIPGKTIRYDAAYVKSRDESEKKRKLRAWLAPTLVHFRVLIGFLPSRIKYAIEEQLGISARNATFASIMVELLVFFAVGTLSLIFDFASMFETSVSPGPGATHLNALTISILVTAVLLLDMLMRFDGYWREDGIRCGFCEWVFRRRRLGTRMRKPANMH